MNTTAAAGADLFGLVSQLGGTALTLAVMAYMLKWFMQKMDKLQEAMAKQVTDCNDTSAKQAADYIARLETRDSSHAQDRENLTAALINLREAVLRDRLRNDNSGPFPLPAVPPLNGPR